MFPNDERLAWQLRSGLAQLLWRERSKEVEKDDDPKAPFEKSAAQVADVREKLGLRD